MRKNVQTISKFSGTFRTKTNLLFIKNKEEIKEKKMRREENVKMQYNKPCNSPNDHSFVRV
jgi:hypothetical protein